MYRIGTDDANIFTPGVYIVSGDTSNLPEGANVGYLVVFSGYGKYALQFYCATNARKLYFRSADNNNWKTWVQLGT